MLKFIEGMAYSPLPNTDDLTNWEWVKLTDDEREYEQFLPAERTASGNFE